MENDKDKKICWGIIGAGNVCNVKSAPAMNKIPGSRIVAVMRRTGEKARAFAALHNIPNWYDNADALLSDPAVNAVYIATPPGSHAELTKRAAAAGKPVYVEKPMARTWRECQDMIEACEQAGVPLFVAYYRRMLPNYRKIRELVDAGAIGEPRSVHIQMNRPPQPEFDADPANWRVDPDQAGGGYFYDLASHQLDFLDYLLGPVTDACGFASNQAGNYRAEDIVTGSFRFGNGVQGTGNWCFNTAKSAATDLTVLTGSKGTLSWPTFEDYYLDLETDPATAASTVKTTAGASSSETASGKTTSSESTTERKTGAGTSSEGASHVEASRVEASTHKTTGPDTRTIRFHFDMPEHIQQPLIETIVEELRGDKQGRCPSTGVTAARTNHVMEQLTGTG